MNLLALEIEATNLVVNVRKAIATMMLNDWSTYKANEDRLEDLLQMAEDRLERRQATAADEVDWKF